MTPRERIMAVLAGEIPDRVPVTLCHINPFETETFWTRHPSFQRLLAKARDTCDTFLFYKPKTGFFFSSPDSVELKEEKKKDSNISEVVTLTVNTGNGPLVRSSRTTLLSSTQWIVKPWVENRHDLENFLSLPHVPFLPDFGDLKEKEQEYGEKSVTVISLPDPVGVAGVLFAPGDLPKFILEEEHLVEQTLETFFERLTRIYRAVASGISRAVIRIRGSENLTPPTLPPGYFPNYRDIFSKFVTRYDSRLIQILREGNFNYVCYHWHDVIDELLPAVLKMRPDMLDPVANTIENPQRMQRIRKICGNNVTLMGGVTLEELEFRSSDEVIRLTQSALGQAAANGRFILAPSGVPTSSPLSPQTEENFLAFIETGVTYGAYPLTV